MEGSLILTIFFTISNWSEEQLIKHDARELIQTEQTTEIKTFPMVVFLMTENIVFSFGSSRYVNVFVKRK